VAAVLLPTLADGSAWYEFSTTVDGLTFRFEFLWNDRTAAWYFNLRDAAGTLLLAGVKVVTGWPLTARYLGKIPNLPPGQFVAIDSAGRDSDPGLATLGEQHQLVYVPAADAAAIQAPRRSTGGTNPGAEAANIGSAQVFRLTDALDGSSQYLWIAGGVLNVSGTPPAGKSIIALDPVPLLDLADRATAYYLRIAGGALSGPDATPPVVVPVPFLYFQMDGTPFGEDAAYLDVRNGVLEVGGSPPA
jgi:hypothetical protein